MMKVKNNNPISYGKMTIQEITKIEQYLKKYEVQEPYFSFLKLLCLCFYV